MTTKIDFKIPDRKLIIYLIPLLVSFYFLLTFAFPNYSELFSSDNARYAYSAIFQGFAAILALMLTAILITRQNMHSQRFAIEERVYKILSSKHPLYIPDTFAQIEKDIETQVFADTFRRNSEVMKGFSDYQRDLLVERTINEIKRKFSFLNEQKIHEQKLDRMFKASLTFISIILIFSLTALLVVPNDSEILSNDQIMSSMMALIACIMLAIFTIEICAILFLDILKIWKLSHQ